MAVKPQPVLHCLDFGTELNTNLGVEVGQRLVKEAGSRVRSLANVPSATRCRCPPDRFVTLRSSSPEELSIFRIAATRVRISSLRQRRATAGHNRTLPNTVICGHSDSRIGTSSPCRVSPAACSPRRGRKAGIVPLGCFLDSRDGAEQVVFPQPEEPRMATNSPGATFRSTPATRAGCHSSREGYRFR